MGRSDGVFAEIPEGLARSRRQVLVAGLRASLDRDGLSVAFQPIVELPGGRVVEFEALARWEDPELGTVTPDEFIPVAEAGGLIDELGLWVLNQACGRAVGWVGIDGQDPPSVAVNVSAVQLDNPAFAADVLGVLASTGLPHHRLCLEITETADLPDLGRAIEALALLRSTGVRTALDDFGTGRAALSALRELPLDVVKIDRCFVSGVASDATDAVMVRALVDAAHHIGLEVCGEGVEGQEQARRLVTLGADRAQGWLFGRPGPAATALPGICLEGDSDVWRGTEEFVLVVDRTGGVRFASASAAGVLGSAVLQGSSVLDLVHDEHRVELSGLVTAAAHGRYEEVAVRAHGSEPDARWLRVRAQAFVRPGTSAADIVLTCRDVSDRVAAETDAAVLDHVLRDTIEVIPVAMAVSDLDGRILRANQAYAALLGRPLDEVVGRTVAELTHPDDRAQDDENLAAAGLDERQQTVRKRYLHADGSAVHATVEVRVVTSPGGRPCAVVAHVDPTTGPGPDHLGWQPRSS